MKLARRTFILAGLALVGCTPTMIDAKPTQSVSPLVGPPPRDIVPEPSLAPGQTSEPTIPVGLARDEMMARFDGRAPGAFGLEVAGVVQRLTRKDAFALTFDACGGDTATSPGMAVDTDIIATLREFKVPATLFLNSRWIGGNRALAEELAGDPLFELGNHGTRHVPLTVAQRSAYGIKGCASVGEAYDEVAGCETDLATLTGKKPKYFRSGTAHVDETAVQLAEALGVKVVNFSVNADAGATLSSAQVSQQFGKVRGGDIVIAHMNRPPGGTAEGLKASIRKLLDTGLTPVKLSDGL